MDRRITWLQPEQLGRATVLWTKIINEARDGLKLLQVSNSMTAKHSVYNRNQDFIPLTSEYQKNGNFYDEKSVNTGISKRKDNIASTYDWNSSGKLKNGGTPWRVPGTVFEEGVVGLHQEIQDFYKFMYPRPEEHVMRQEVVARVANIIKSIWPEAKVEIYGSCKTQLYLPTSDIDLVVFGELGGNPCCQLGDELRNSDLPEAGSIKVLDKASVPIVKLTDQRTRVRVDISFNMATTTRCAELIANFIGQYPNLPYLVFVLKQFLLQRDLNEVWTGGISSYSLILMIVSFLQLHVPPEPTNLGVLLIEFFELYGVLFNYFKTGISVDNGGFYFPKDDPPNIMDSGFSLLCIVDPMSPGLDLGRSSFGFMEVRKSFGYAYRVLSRAVLPALDQDSNGHSILGRIIRVTDEVVEHRKWVQQTWAQKAHTIYHYPFPVCYNIAQPETFYVPQEDTALRIAQPQCPTKAPIGENAPIPAPEESCQADSNKSAMDPSAAISESSSQNLIIKVSSISSSSSGENPQSSSDSESEMSSQTSTSSLKEIVDTAVGPSGDAYVSSTASGHADQPCTDKTLKNNEQTNTVPSQTRTDSPQIRTTIRDTSPTKPPHRQLIIGETRLSARSHSPLNISETSHPVKSCKPATIRDGSPIKGCDRLTPASSPQKGGSNPSSPQKHPRTPITPHIEVTVSSNNKSEIPAQLPPRSPKANQKGSSSPVSHQHIKTKTFTNSNYLHSSSGSNIGNLNTGVSSGIHSSSSGGSSGGDSNNNGGQSTANKGQVTKTKKQKKKKGTKI